MVLAHNVEDGGRTQDVQISQSVTFDSMLLTPDTLRGLHNSGFYKPSPIQLHGIPLGKCGFDLLLEAKSGTGKTAVFSIIALEQLDLTKALQAVILAPTREIAAQICDVMKQIGSHYKGLRVEVVMGGLPVYEDIAKFKDDNIHIVVGSPGRLRHLIQDKHINTSAVRLLILDEADKLLEKSFLSDINYIFSILPKQKQVIMSSATYPTGIKKIIKQYVQNAQHICPDSNSILLGITQKITVVQHNSNIVKQTTNRFEELLNILSKYSFKQCLIFCNYQARVGELHKMLKKHKWPAEQLYGQQEQLERLDALKSLQEYKCRVLICTDLAARGIDASNVDLVINFEPPFEWQTYLHRIGRAGRFGSYGIAITILSKGREEKSFEEILKTIKFPINSTKEGNFTINDDTLQVIELNLESTDVKTAGKYEKLWGVLTRDVKEISDDVVNFENLCSSYNTVKDRIESFSDLLNSLEGHILSNGTSNTYTHLKMQPILICEYLKNISTKTNESKLKNGTIFINNAEFEENNINSEYNSDLKKKLIEDKEHLSNYFKDNINCDRNKNEAVGSSYEFDDTTQALLNARLPTAFGRPKITRMDNNHKYSKNNGYISKHHQNDILYDEKTKEANKNRLFYKDTEDSDTSQGFYNVRKEKVDTKIKCENKYQRKTVSKSGYDVDDEHYDNVYKTSNSRYSSQTNSSSHSRNANASEIETDQYNTDSYEEVSYRSKNLSYINWFNTLKLRTKELEYAIYIEEMSKLGNQ